MIVIKVAQQHVEEGVVGLLEGAVGVKAEDKVAIFQELFVSNPAIMTGFFFQFSANTCGKPPLPTVEAVMLAAKA